MVSGGDSDEEVRSYGDLKKEEVETVVMIYSDVWCKEVVSSLE